MGKKQERSTYQGAISRLLANMEDAPNAMVRTPNGDESTLAEHHANLTEVPMGERCYITDISDDGIARITRLDRDGIRTSDQTLVVPSGAPEEAFTR